MKTRKIIHIGLAKTGTTMLQQHFLPRVCKEKNFLFNPPEYLKIKKKKLLYDKEDLTALKQVFDKHNVFISHEGLVDPNPRNWSTASSRALELFGADATIIITIRDPIDYMCSLYVQKIHEGNIVRAQDFFVSSTKYDEMKPFLPERSIWRYDHQKLDYEYLKSLYMDKFNDVFIVPLSRIDTLYPFDTLFSLSNNEIKNFTDILKNAPRLNRSYSKLAIKLTFTREVALRSLGLKTIGSEDYLSSNAFVEELNSDPAVSFSLFRIVQKIIGLPLKALKKSIRPWRWWMQRVVDRAYPYQKFVLPKEVLNEFDNDLLSVNEQFIRNFEESIDALKTSSTDELDKCDAKRNSR